MKKTKAISNMVIVTREFGYDLFIAPLKNLELQITNKKEEAEKWSETHDQTKLNYYRTVTGYKGLAFEKI